MEGACRYMLEEAAKIENFTLGWANRLNAAEVLVGIRAEDDLHGVLEFFIGEGCFEKEVWGGSFGGVMFSESK
jgi:hypothetical protein